MICIRSIDLCCVKDEIKMPNHRPVVWTMMGTVCPLFPMEQWVLKMDFMSDLES